MSNIKGYTIYIECKKNTKNKIYEYVIDSEKYLTKPGILVDIDEKAKKLNASFEIIDEGSHFKIKFVKPITYFEYLKAKWFRTYEIRKEKEISSREKEKQNEENFKKKMAKMQNKKNQDAEQYKLKNENYINKNGDRIFIKGFEKDEIDELYKKAQKYAKK